MTGREKGIDRRLFLTLGIISAIGYSNLSLILPALPSLQQHFNIPVQQTQLLVSLAFVVMGIGNLCFGLLADRYSPYKLLLWSMVLFSASNLSAAITDSYFVLLASRVVQALTGSAAITIARVVSITNEDRDIAATALSYVVFPISIVPLLAPPIGGLIIDSLGWQGIFSVCAGAGLVATCLTATSAKKIDRTPAKEQIALVDDILRIARNRVFQGYSVHHAFVIVAVQIIGTAAPLIVITRMGFSATEYGLFAILPAIGTIMGSYAATRLVIHFGGDRVIYYGAIIAVAGYTAIFFASSFSSLTPYTLFGPMFFIGFSNALVLPSSTTGALTQLQNSRGAAIGLLSLLQWLAAGLIVQTMAPWLEGSESLVLMVTLITYLVAIAGFLAGRYAMKRY